MTTPASPLCRIAHYVPASWVPGVSAFDPEDIAGICAGVRQMGFDSVLVSHDSTSVVHGRVRAAEQGSGLQDIAQACRDAGLALLVDVSAPADLLPQTLSTWPMDVLQGLPEGVSGVRCRGLNQLDAVQWRQFCRVLKEPFPDLWVLAWTPGLAHDQLPLYRDVGFDACFSSLAWWDQRSPWMVSEYEYLRDLAPVIAPLALMGEGEALDPRLLVDNATLVQQMWVAAYTGQGLMMDVQRLLDPALAGHVGDVCDWLGRGMSSQGTLTQLSGPLSRDAVLYWSGGAPYALVLHELDDDSLDAAVRILRSRLPDGFVVSASPVRQSVLRSRAASLLAVSPGVPVKARHVAATGWQVADATVQGAASAGARSHRVLKQAMDADRIAIDRLEPHVDGGRFSVKLTLGRAVHVQATVYMDGHAPLAVALLWRAADETQWQHVPMQALGNDRWTAQFVPQRLGRHCYTVQAWVNTGDAPHRTRQCPVFPLQVERRESEYSSWYELFPRSMGKPGEHGRLVDVMAHLPRIRAMGFDVLYFPPVHPIGTTNRKGRNNTLTAGAGDPGSPYAIGAGSGGHDAIHPELGTLDDFRALVIAARHHELEIALDFAIQCSPDHPWLREHPEWFKWREDGTVQYAENPPKRYEDIVNPDFYSATAGTAQRMALWRALRDVVLFWADQGVRMFRVDNPHTKPLPFWEWMIAQVQRQHPDVVFLSEAFTRPAMMHRLAKLGFSQSYTYFTWRNTKAELTDYLTEIASPAQLDYFRPHFFVNTPDINPYFLQASGRAGFLIRAALAATTSGLWGVYSGFELCEAQALPGREEYQDAEKYEIKSRDWDQAGNIVAEITRLNAIRRANPALQTHRGIRIHAVNDERVLFFSKATDEGDNIVLVTISLSPRETVSVRLEIPPWIRARSAGSKLRLQSLWDDRVHTTMTGELHATLRPGQPFALWSVLA